MNRTLFSLFTACALLLSSAAGAAVKKYAVSSPDGTVSIAFTSAVERLDFEVAVDSKTVISDSKTSLGGDMRVASVKKWHNAGTIKAINYIKAQISDDYNAIALKLRNGYTIQARAYDDGVAFRYIVGKTGGTVENEVLEFSFPGDCEAFVPYVRKAEGKHICRFSEYFQNSYENLYTRTRISEMRPDSLAFMPLLLKTDDGVCLCITDADLQAYPGLNLYRKAGENTLKAAFAPRPRATHVGGAMDIQNIVDEYEPFIAKVNAGQALPWRVIAIERNEKDLLNSDMVQRLSEASRIADTGWIVPGKSTWEWWNSCGLTGVDFKAGINTATYKAYIDFAAGYGLEYALIDDGWEAEKGNLLNGWRQEVDLPEILSYAKEKGVGILLWMGYSPFAKDMEDICRKYSDMGVKGFKIDFMDHDDQTIAEFLYAAAETAAEYHLVLDFHGIHKPAGLQRTWPNVLNFEGVHGLEQMKWSPEEIDQITYDVTMPYIRMLAGPVDYTQGAMRNGAPKCFAPLYDEPMSQGTRCRQMAEYVVFHSPLVMLCDSPSLYERNAECTRFIAGIPTVWDETVAIDGKVGEYICIARRKGNDWYLAGLAGRESHDFEIPLDFIGDGKLNLECFADGKNSDVRGEDYIHYNRTADGHLTVKCAVGGGFVAKITKQ